jgi:hypothetical protein
MCISFALLGLLLGLLAVAYFLTIWFDGAKFFIEYLKLAGLANKIPHVKKYLTVKSQGSPDTYLEYIEVNKDNFLTRLVTCPKCFSFWISVSFILSYVLAVCLFDLEAGLFLLAISTVLIPAVAFCGLYLYFKIK